jgi:hypothetical protein
MERIIGLWMAIFTLNSCFVVSSICAVTEVEKGAGAKEIEGVC